MSGPHSTCTRLPRNLMGTDILRHWTAGYQTKSRPSLATGSSRDAQQRRLSRIRGRGRKSRVLNTDNGDTCS